MSAHSIADQISGSVDSCVAVEPQFGFDLTWPPLVGRPDQSGAEFMLSSARVLPDPAVCRAKAAGFGDYVDWLVEHPYQCPHALRFGSETLCRHRQRDEIVMSTSARG